MRIVANNNTSQFFHKKHFQAQWQEDDKGFTRMCKNLWLFILIFHVKVKVIRLKQGGDTEAHDRLQSANDYFQMSVYWTVLHLKNKQ